jgi:Protein of unknown function (DUF559)
MRAVGGSRLRHCCLRVVAAPGASRGSSKSWSRTRSSALTAGCGFTATPASGATRSGFERGIRVTTPARAILDYAAIATDRELAYALDQAEKQELTDYPALDALARAHPRHRGSTRLRRTLAEYEAGSTGTRSDLEKACLALCERHGFPRPLVNQPLCGMTVDFVFVAQRVVVETDSWRWHRGRAAFERDRERDALLAAAGYTTLRFTDRQIELAEASVVQALGTALRRRAA